MHNSYVARELNSSYNALSYIAQAMHCEFLKYSPKLVRMCESNEVPIQVTSAILKQLKTLKKSENF